MAFPQAESITSTQFSSDLTSHLVDMPASVASGDLLLIFFTSRLASVEITTPSGWTAVYKDSRDITAAAYAKVAVGDEGSQQVDLVTDSATTGAAQVYRISGWYGDLASLVVSAGTRSVNAAPDPGTASSILGAVDVLYLAVAHIAPDDIAADSAPADYTHLTNTISGAGASSGASVATARRELAAGSDNPGEFALSENEAWWAYTIAIMPPPSETVPRMAPEIASAEAYCINIDTGRAYYAKHPNRMREVASVTKYMCARVLLHHKPTLGDLTGTTITIQSSDLEYGGTGNNLQAGDQITLLESLRNIMMTSSNNNVKAVARVIGQELLDAESNSGGDPEARFLDEMNQLGAEIGLESTTWTTPSGYPGVQNANLVDLAKVVASLRGETILWEVLFWFSYGISSLRGGSPRTINATRGTPPLNYPGEYGNKAGDTGSVLCLWEAPNGQMFVAAVNNSATRMHEIATMLDQLVVDFPELNVPSSPWTPTDMFTALEAGGAWIDFTDPSTLFADTLDGTPASVDGNVAVARDKSGNDNHLSLTNVILRSDGTDYWVEYNGTNSVGTFGVDRIDGTGLYPVSGEQFMVFTRTACTDDGAIVSRGPVGTAIFQIYHSASDSDRTPALSLRGGTIEETSELLNDGNAHPIGAVWDGTRGGIATRTGQRGNASVGSATENSSNLIDVGTRAGGAAWPFKGRYYHCIIVDKFDIPQYRRANSFVSGAAVNQFADPTGGVSEGGGAAIAAISMTHHRRRR